MTKQEKIQEAYGQHWDKVKFYVDENGLIDCKHFIDFGINIPFDRIGFNFRRPKSLQGIEDNNGWIKIESEEDLLKINDEYFYYCGLIDKTGFYPNPKPKTGAFVKHESACGYVNRYQPIEKPKPPIY